MSEKITQSDLEAYLDEQLPPQDAAGIESALRDDPQLTQQLAAINNRRDAGLHTLGEIWRRHRVSCPTREQLGSYLLDAIAAEQADYIRFHLEQIGCRYCQANSEDLRRRQQESSQDVTHRRNKYFQSSAGYLRPKK